MTLENEDGDEDEEIVHKVTQLHLTSWPDHGVGCTITNDHGVGCTITINQGVVLQVQIVMGRVMIL